MVSQRVRSLIKCTNCLRPRCIYALSKLNHEQVVKIKRIDDDASYICGALLFPDGHKYASTIVVRMSLSCEKSVMELTYYAAKITFPEVCFHCGGRSASNLCNNETIKELKKEFAKVRPICISCMTDGKEPTTWGPRNNLSKKKK